MPQDEQTRWLNDALAGVKRSAFFMGKAMVSFFNGIAAFFFCLSSLSQPSREAPRVVSIPIHEERVSEMISLSKCWK